MQHDAAGAARTGLALVPDVSVQDGLRAAGFDGCVRTVDLGGSVGIGTGTNRACLAGLMAGMDDRSVPVRGSHVNATQKIRATGACPDGAPKPVCGMDTRRFVASPGTLALDWSSRPGGIHPPNEAFHCSLSLTRINNSR